MNRTAIGAARAFVMLAALTAIAMPAQAALEKCKVKIDSKTGTLFVAAEGVTGTLLWGETAGNETNPFSDAGCVTAGEASGCTLAAPGTVAAITPPAGCTLYLADGASTCSVYIRRCTPGVRNVDTSALEARVQVLEDTTDELDTRVRHLENLVRGIGQRMFVTSASTSGNFGGLAGGDALCMGAAASAGLPGAWVAWLSDSATDAIDRLAVSGGPFVTMDAQLIAIDTTDLTDGLLVNAVQLNEFANPHSNYVWTGTLTDGNSAGSSCFDWTSTAGIGMSGVTGTVNAAWTQNGGGAACVLGASLLCIEQ